MNIYEVSFRGNDTVVFISQSFKYFYDKTEAEKHFNDLCEIWKIINTCGDYETSGNDITFRSLKKNGHRYEVVEQWKVNPCDKE